MKSLSLLVGASALIATSSAQATFVRWDVVNVGTVSGRDIYQVFAVFDNASNVVLNCLQHQVLSGSINALHTDSFVNDSSDPVGHWNASYTSASTAATSNQYRDSYVTISGKTGANAQTALDPSFGTGVGPNGIPFHAGWYTSNPAAPIVVGSTLRIKMMQIALAAGDAGYTAKLGMGYKASTATTTPQWGWGNYTVGVPAPGAIALIGVAGLVGRRRRA
jgi:MYXO-CTERM domain-containing protein